MIVVMIFVGNGVAFAAGCKNQSRVKSIMNQSANQPIQLATASVSQLANNIYDPPLRAAYKLKLNRPLRLARLSKTSSVTMVTSVRHKPAA